MNVKTLSQRFPKIARAATMFFSPMRKYTARANEFQKEIPSDNTLERKEQTPITSVRQLLDVGTTMMVISAFRSSPLQHGQSEGLFISLFLHEALKQGVPLSKVRVDPAAYKEDSPDGPKPISWKDYVMATAKEGGLSGRPGVINNLLVDEQGFLMPSSELAVFIKEKVVFFQLAEANQL